MFKQRGNKIRKNHGNIEFHKSETNNEKTQRLDEISEAIDVQVLTAINSAIHESVKPRPR